MEEYSAKVAAWFPGTAEEYERIRQAHASSELGCKEVKEMIACINCKYGENLTWNPTCTAPTAPYTDPVLGKKDARFINKNGYCTYAEVRDKP